MQNTNKFALIVREAEAAGRAAAQAATPTPMIVTDSSRARHYYVAGGVCGFAWVAYPGNTGFARWTRDQGISMKGHPTGQMVWVSEGGQSREIKAAYAAAYASVLQSHGIKARAVSRMD